MSKSRMSDMAVIDSAILDEDENIPQTAGGMTDLPDAGIAPPPPPDELAKLADALKQTEADKDKPRDAQEEIEHAKEQAKAAVDAVVETTKETASKIGDAISNATGDARATLERVRTPGSILLPLGILILLVLCIIPINGYPRIAWLWLVITRNAALPGITPKQDAGPPPDTGQTQEAPVTYTSGTYTAYTGNEEVY